MLYVYEHVAVMLSSYLVYIFKGSINFLYVIENVNKKMSKKGLFKCLFYTFVQTVEPIN